MESIVDYIINLIESASMAWFFASMMQIKQQKKISYLLCVFAFNFISITISNYLSPYDLVLAVYLTVGNTLISYYFSNNSLYESCFYVCLEGVLIASANMVALLLFDSFPKQLCFLLVRVLYILFGLYLIRYFKKKELFFNPKGYIQMSIGLYGLYFFIWHLVNMYYVYPEEFKDTRAIFVVLFVAIVVLLKAMIEMSDLFKSQYMYNKLKTEKQNEKILSLLYEEVKITKHDLKHDYEILHYYLKENELDKIEDYLHQKMNHINKLPVLVYSSNDVINMIINNKIIQAYAKKIKMFCDIQIGKSLSITEVELNDLLSNILDNAIENCSEHGVVNVHLFQDQNLLHIRVENDVDKRTDFITKKDRKSHGFGLKSIERIASKYYGQLSLTQNDTQFILETTLLLP